MQKLFTKLANTVAKAAGRPLTFGVCVLIVVVWGLTGPIFGFNNTWQLVINTGTTIVTFLMVFLIQNTQNREGAAMQAKLDELVHAVRAADERFVGIEHLTDRELEKILEDVEARAHALHKEGRPVIQTRAQDAKAARADEAKPTAKPKPKTARKAKA